MNKGKVFAIALALLLLAFLIYFFAFKNNSATQKKILPPSTKVTRGNIEVNVSGTGTLLPTDTYEITSSDTGTIKEVFVKNGDTVEKGDKIAEFTNGALVKAPASGIVSGLQIKADQEIKQSQSQAAPQTQILSPQASSAQMLAPPNQYNNAQTYDAANTFGKVLNIDKMLIIFPVDEVDILKIKTGQQAKVLVDALPERNFTGKVVEIAQEGVVQNNVGTFDVTIELANQDKILKSGMTANITIIAQHKENVLLMPIEALQQSGQQKYVLVAAADGKSEKKTVQIGLTNESYAEIIKGLQAGDKVLLPSLVEENNQMGMGPFGAPSKK